MNAMNEQFTAALKAMFPSAVLAPDQMQQLFPMNAQMTNLLRANIDAQISAATSLGTAAVESFQKIVDLNMSTARATLEDSTAMTHQLLAAKDMQEAMSLTVAQAQPTVAKALSYGRHLAEIASAAQDTLARASALQLNETNSRMNNLASDAAKNAPPGSGNVLEVMKMAMNAASANVEWLNRATRQAAEQTQANVDTAVSRFVHAADSVTGANTNHRARK